MAEWITRNYYRLTGVRRLADDSGAYNVFDLWVGAAMVAEEVVLEPAAFEALTLDLGLRPVTVQAVEYESAQPPLYRAEGGG